MSSSINPQNNRDFNQGILHIWSKFGVPSLNGWWVIARQAQNGVNFDFEVKSDLEGQGQSPPKTIGILTNVFYTYSANLVILAWTGDELSRGQANAYRTHKWTDGHTDRQTQATTIPEGQNWLRVKIKILLPQLFGKYCYAHSRQI